MGKDNQESYFCGMELSVSAKTLKWLLRFYPPFLFQRVWIEKIQPDYKQADIRVFKSLLNINGNRSIFGGTIFSSIDPIHTLLLNQIFKQQGIHKTVAWLKSAKIDYIKPAKKSLSFSIKLHDEDISSALADVKNNGKVVKTFVIDIFDKDGLLCAQSQNEIYIRDLGFDFSTLNTQTHQPYIKSDI
ncbi:DUF4442 domain-containing protein [Sphingobacterium psychroaquaticum]|uniref:DUF4442 domain-containing protein n=1 Tax=Sphingobacterium psychroaquaticum TaxID=561061 RepID=A0A1X7JL65_9SPHI|nr:DUF4442 domain-containing protein [Sphingobacterium psychroaquaticum]SMG28338.1 protein of unknown function [Sphingobacterium psychroaquaticum]